MVNGLGERPLSGPWPGKQDQRGLPAFAAVDLGASNGRVVIGIVSPDAVLIHEVHRFPNLPHRVGGSLTWDVDQLFNETLTGLAVANAEARKHSAHLAGIGVDSWGVDFAIMDEAGAASPVRSHRAVADPRPHITARSLREPEIYAQTGVPDQAINTSFQLAALAAQQPRIGGEVLFVPDLWVHRLTGRSGTEATIASTSQLFNPRADRWVPDLLAGLHAPALRMPQVHRIGSRAGATTPAVTKRLGLPIPIPVYRVAGHDTASAFAFATPVAHGAPAEGLVSSGTWSLVGLPLQTPLTTTHALAGGFTNERGVEGILLLRNLNGMWLLQQCLAQWAAEDGRAVDLQQLLDEAERQPRHAAVIDVADERLLPIGNMPARIITMCHEVGRPLDGSRPGLIRAVLDSLAEAYRHSLAQAAQLTGCTIDRIRIVGGGARNATLCRITAELTGLPVIAGPVEASAIGNIAVQTVAAGAREDIPAVYADLAGPGTETVTHLPRKVRAAATEPEETR